MAPEIEAEATDAQIAHAARVLAQGQLVAFPTETVYGLGADAENPLAVSRIYAAKGRPSNHPVIVHVAPDADLAYWAADIPAPARALIDAFWPGPLTIILKRATHIDPAVSGGQDSVGLRCPSHPVAQRLLRAFAALRPNGQGGVAGPSANRFGHVSPTRAEHVRAEFPDEVAQGMPVLQGGASAVGIESTIVDLSRVAQGVGPVLLRPGHITADDIARVLGRPPALPDAAAPRASGTLRAHYAPRTPLLLVTREQLEAAAVGIGLPEHGADVAVAYTPRPLEVDARLVWQPVAAEPEPYAQALYALLRELDGKGYRRILVEAPPRTPEWAAVNDRIGRAAAAFEPETPRG
ncbi:threonylcarbamoyl-AMP synthase [Bordetella genomosp. 9]|uniref:L-threonylcarbamoyladenylate synthase n=1 Tax=Bordetella genomosp. 9 TaxID=1416803 RepID=UPI000A296970|nr:L-threonylcarbamoyladenylate synthase [Bordetella genomosp. 9]ARP91684.1 threonylcarbamoyl-AMP synthase [Bordetella genomosp. 9]